MTHCERLLAALADGEWHTHHELYALRMIVHSRVADLRRQGHTVEQRRNGDLYEYRLVSRALDDPQVGPQRGASDGSLRIVERPSPPPMDGALASAPAFASPGPALQLDLFEAVA